MAVADAIVATEGLGSSHGLRPNAQFQGRNVDGVVFWTNGIDTRTQGLDVAATWRLRNGSWGAAEFGATGHFNNTKITANRNDDFIRATQTMAITEAQPGMRLGVFGDLRHGSGVGGRVRLNRIGELTTPTLFEDPVTLEAATVVDVEANFNIGSDLSVAVGAKNLGDALPTRLPDDNVGQLWNMNYPNESPIGLLGRLVYLRLDMFGR